MEVLPDAVGPKRTGMYGDSMMEWYQNTPMDGIGTKS
jgi:hypothetical protein